MPDLPEIGVRAVIADKAAFISGMGEINQAVKDSGKSFNDSVKPTDAFEKSLGHFSDRFTKLNSNLGVAKGLIRDVNAQTAEGTTAAGGMAGGLEAAAAAAGALTVAAAALIVTQAVAWLDEMNGALSRMAAQMGITQAQAEQFAPAIRNLASTGLVDNFDQGAEAIQLVSEKLRGLSKDGGPDVQEIARQAAGMADAWNTSVPTVVNGAQALINKFPQIGPAVNSATDAFKKGSVAQGYWTTVTNTNAKEVGKLTPQIQKAKDALAAFTPTMDKHGKITAGSLTHYKTLNLHLGELETKLKGATTSTQEWMTTTEASKVPVTKTVLSAKEALDLMTKAAQEGHVSVESISQSIQTSGGFFANAGFSAKEALQLISAGAQNGVTNMTGLGRAVDSFHKGIVNPPKGFNEALSDMGLTKVADQLRTNQITMSDAMSQVFDSFNSITDPLVADEAAMKLFGVRSDQLGGPQVLGALANFKEGLKNTTDAAQNVANVMQDDGTLGTAIKKFGAGIKNWVEDGAQHAYDAVKGIQWDQVGKGIQDGLANIGPTLTSMWETLKGDATKLWNGITSAIESALTTVVTYIANVAWPNVTSAAQAIWDAIKAAASAVWESLKDTVSTAFTSVTTAINNALTPVQQAIQSVIDAVQSVWDSVFGPAGWISTNVGSAIQKAIDIVNGFIAGVQRAFNAIANVIMSALQPALDFIKSVANSIGSIGGSIKGVMSTLHIGGYAEGGQLSEGLSVVGEKGPELAYKRGGSVQIISNNQSALAMKAMTAITMPAYAAAFGVFPQTSPMIGGATNNNNSNVTNNNSRSFSVSMSGVKDGNDAVRRFATMNALRGI